MPHTLGIFLLPVWPLTPALGRHSGFGHVESLRDRLGVQPKLRCACFSRLPCRVDSDELSLGFATDVRRRNHARVTRGRVLETNLSKVGDVLKSVPGRVGIRSKSKRYGN